MGTMMKNEKDLLTIQIKCEGPIKGLTVTADVNGNVKGYVENPDVMLPPSKAGKLDVAAALDLGVLSVIKDMGLKEPYVGPVSYTHLAVFSRGRCKDCKRGRDIYKNCRHHKDSGSDNDHGKTVSYTHLDVYKRQSWCRYSRSCCMRLLRCSQKQKSFPHFE